MKTPLRIILLALIALGSMHNAEGESQEGMLFRYLREAMTRFDHEYIVNAFHPEALDSYAAYIRKQFALTRLRLSGSTLRDPKVESKDPGTAKPKRSE